MGFTRTSVGPDILYQTFDGQDGFEYLAVMLPRGDVSASEQLKYLTQEWEGVGANTHRVSVTTGSFTSHHPGPVVCSLFRRKK